MDWMKSLPAMGIALYLLEIGLILGVLYGLFRLFKRPARMRHRVCLLALFPGTFAWAAGWIGVVFPLPAVLGLPFIAYCWLADNAMHDALWLPAPLFVFSAVRSGLPMHADWILYEAGLLLLWLLVARWTSRHTAAPAPGT